MLLPAAVLCALLLGASDDLRFHDVPGDGNCLFSAVALSAAIVDDEPLGRSRALKARAKALQGAAARLRAAAMDLLCPFGAPAVDLTFDGLPASLLMEPRGNEGAKGYCARMRRSGEWGSTAELLALTRVLRRPIRVHTDFGVETYGAEMASRPLAVHFRNDHYRAVTEPAEPEEAACSEAASETDSEGEGSAPAGGGAPAGGAAGSGSNDPDEAAVAAVLDALHAAAAAADGARYFSLFSPAAVFLGTDPAERWTRDEFEAYAGARFARGDGWAYVVRGRHVSVRGELAWFDEALHGAALGACRGTGVLERAVDAEGGWRIVQYSLTMAIPNDAALEVAELARRAERDSGAVD